MRVNEIFYSLQGEGKFTGTPAVFLRMSGCNMKCPFCDTQHQSYTEMTEEEIVREVSQYKARHIVITGGEPTLQLTASLCERLHHAGFFIQIETNGSMPLPEGCEIDWITCSPKDLPGTCAPNALPDSVRSNPVTSLHIQRIDELKVLFMHQDMSQYDSIQAKEYRLQPLDTGNEEENKNNVKETIDYILDNPKWNLSLQTHKILNVR